MKLSILQIAHILAAIFSTWRITELFTQDRITQKLREKYPTYIWQCQRCMSVWAGLAATVMFCVLPWSNWALALAYFYVVHVEATVQKRIAKYGRRFTVVVQSDGKYELSSDFNQQELQGLMNIVYPNNKAQGTAAN